MISSDDRYQLQDKLHDGSRAVVFRATRLADRRPVVLKLLKPEMAGPHNLRRVHSEFKLLRELASETVIAALDCEPMAGSQVLVLEDIGGQSLAQLRGSGALPAEDFLPLAIRWVEAVRELHRRNVVHRDLNPSNVLISPPTLAFRDPGWQLRLIDFDTATLRPREEMELRPASQIEGSLPYLSPEQSGRMNRVADYRADYYALGVSFYELLTGRLPFDAEDTLGWLHCHLAVTPTAPHEVDSRVPLALSRIVMRLLAKSPEDRYQSATGLLLDLRQCLAEDAGRGVAVGFVPGSDDLPEQLRLPQRLYGRDAQIEQLVGAFDRTREGGLELALVAGAAGSGKTALVRHVINLGANLSGHVLEGKFDQYKRDIPYAGWIQAFNRLLQFWLSETPERLAGWRQRILDGVGDSAAMLTAVLPNSAWLVGEQPRPGADVEQAQHQFDFVLQRFVECVASAEHPLVIFLDDLQWADAASIRLLKILLEDPQLDHFLVVGAYRLGEVGGDHPLVRARAALHNPRLHELDIVLEGLAPHDVGRLLADAMRTLPDRVGPLVDALFERSGGNPFELSQLLEALQEQNVIRFDSARRCWDWDDASLSAFRIAARSGGMPVVALLEALPEATLQVLQLAACMGDRFRAAALALVLNRSEDVLAEQLGAAVQDGLVLPVDGGYRFVHDRVRQSIYDGLAPAERRGLHQRIGQSLQAGSGSDDLFEVVYQLNRAGLGLDTPAQRRELTRLNLEAARRARAGVAYAEAGIFAAAAVELLPGDAWQQDTALAFSVHRELARLCYLSGDFDAAEAWIEVMLAQPLAMLQRAEALNLQMTVNTMRARYDAALVSAREALDLLGVSLPGERADLACEDLISGILSAMAELPDGALAEMQDMQSEELRMAVRILATLAPITYFVDQSLYPYVVGRLTRLCMDHGPTRDTAFGYASFGLILASRKAFFSAYRFGEAAEALAERFRDPGQQCKALQIVANHVKLWGAPIANADALNGDVYRLGLQSGELQFAGYSRNNHVLNGVYMGVSLQGLDERIDDYLAFCRSTGNVIAEDTINSVRLSVRNLLGKTADNLTFSDDRFADAKALLEHCLAHDSNYAACSLLVHQGMVLYLYEEYQLAAQCLAEAADYLAYMPASIAVVQWHLFSALVHAARAGEDAAAVARVQEQRDALALLAEHAPANFLHAQLLVDAELARLRGEMWQAMALYDQAIDMAEEHGFYHHQAMANELAGRFWLAAGKGGQARLHLDAAHAGYRHWGAVRKAADLRRRYLSLWLEGSIDAATLLSEKDTERLDWFALLKATQAMTAEINMDRLMATIMDAVIENAGAERGVLLLQRDDDWWVEAQGGNDEAAPLASAEALADSQRVARGIVYYVARSGEDVVLGDACSEGAFVHDPDVHERQLRSVLCTPLTHKGQVLGALYLENNLASYAFSPERLAVLKVLAGQAAVALQNARLYGDLERRVKERTHQLERLNARLEVLASTDHLTGVMNRRRFQEQVELMLAQARRYGTPVAIMLFDIDHFKAVNDRFGHGMGDRVLQEIARRAQAMLRDTDVLARWGGEEFIVLTQHADVAEARGLAERLRSAIAGTPFSDVGTLTASFGVAWSAGGDTPEGLVGAADDALYAAKAAGRNCVRSASD